MQSNRGEGGGQNKLSIRGPVAAIYCLVDWRAYSQFVDPQIPYLHGTAQDTDEPYCT